MIVERRFANTPASITRARRFATEVVERVAPALCEPVAIMVSELATNSIRHAATEFVVAIAIDGAGVRVEVTDYGPGRPSMRAPDVRRPSGRGLRIVQELADTWKVTPAGGKGPGKTVSFAIAAR